MDGDLAHAYTVRTENGHVVLAAQGGGSPADLTSPTELDSLEEAASRILESELGMLPGDDVVQAFASDMLEPRLPQAKVSADQLWRWIDG